MYRRRMEEVLSEPPAWLLPLLLPLALLYASAAALNRSLYQLGILRQRNLTRPVISVGNLTVGGGGKTPVVMWLAGTLYKMGLKPAILSRGYGRKGTGIRIVDRGLAWHESGDEPAMMTARLPYVPVVVSANRHAAGREILKQQDIDLFILDDGFQHRALRRDLDIVVVDGRRRFGNGRLLPAGILREPVSRLNVADLIIVTKTGKKDPVFEDFLKRHSPAPVLWSDYRPADLVRIDPEGTGSGEDLPSGPLLAFCGIASPDGFRYTLGKTHIHVVDLLAFPDHHHYSAADVKKILETAAGCQAAGLVTTEKDAVRWPRVPTELPVYYLPVQLELEIGPAEEIVEEILTLVRGERAASRE